MKRIRCIEEIAVWGKAQNQTWAFFMSSAVRGAALFFATVTFWSTDLRATEKTVEELNAGEKKLMIQKFLEEGDRYVVRKDYNRANATYERVFLLDHDNLDASKRIERLKKQMLKEGVLETELVSQVYDEEISGRVEEYLKLARILMEQEKWGEARFTLEKLLLIAPLHQEANRLYQVLKKKTAGDEV